MRVQLAGWGVGMVRSSSTVAVKWWFVRRKMTAMTDYLPISRWGDEHELRDSSFVIRSPTKECLPLLRIPDDVDGDVDDDVDVLIGILRSVNRCSTRAPMEPTSPGPTVWKAVLLRGFPSSIHPPTRGALVRQSMLLVALQSKLFELSVVHQTPRAARSYLCACFILF